MTGSEIKLRLAKALASEADASLAKVGFARSAKGIRYARKLPEAMQVFNISLAVRPKYHREAIAHIYPRVNLSIWPVCEVAEKLVSESPVLLANAPDVMVNRPLEHLVPKAQRIQWYAYRADDFDHIAGSVAAQCLKWGLPFLDDYRTALDVVRGHESGDERPRLQENWYVFVIAAYLCLGRREAALETANRAFALPGPRRKFAPVFASLDQLVHEAGSDSR
jgi:hypothetical protein